MIFCSKCKIAFAEDDIVKLVKKKDGIYFYHIKCWGRETGLITGKQASDIASGVLVFIHGQVKNILSKRNKISK